MSYSLAVTPGPYECECCGLLCCHEKSKGIGYYCPPCLHHHGQLEDAGRQPDGETGDEMEWRQLAEHRQMADQLIEQLTAEQAAGGPTVDCWAVLVNAVYPPRERSDRVPCSVRLTADGPDLLERVTAVLTTPPATHIIVLRDDNAEQVIGVKVNTADFVEVGAAATLTPKPVSG